METWLKVSLLLCLYGFFLEMRPSDPFLFEYLVKDRGNVTEQQIIEIIYPLGTYFNFGLMVIFLVITDMLRYKPVIVLSAFSAVSYIGILIWTTSFEALFVLQFFFGLFLSTEVAYYTYIYAKVERHHFQQVTSNSRSAILVGKLFGSVLGQVLIYLQWTNIKELLYISFGTQMISLAVSVILPSVGLIESKDKKGEYCAISSAEKEIDDLDAKSRIDESAKMSPVLAEVEMTNLSVYRSCPVDETESTSNEKITNYPETGEEPNDEIKQNNVCPNALNLLWRHFNLAYSNKTVLIWSTWWAAAMSGFLLIFSYIQPLWYFIDPESNNLWNGAAEALLTLLGSLSAMSAALINQETIEKWDIWILCICSALQGSFIWVAAFARDVFVAYAAYIAFGTVHHFMITITSAIIAKFLVDDSFAWIFGINTIGAIFFEVIITIVFVSGNVFYFNPREQFVAFGGLFFSLSCIYGFSKPVCAVLSLFKKCIFVDEF